MEGGIEEELHYSMKTLNTTLTGWFMKQELLPKELTN